MRIIILILFSFFFVQQVNAASWLIVNKQSKEILSLSPEDDAQLPNSDYEKIILDEDFGDIVLSEHPTFYKYNGNFVKNIKKISDRELQIEEDEERAEEEGWIKDRMRKNAMDELKLEGKIFKHTLK